jgi:PPOX class probable F420-dependent enzyme
VDEPLIELESEFGARVARHLREEIIIWLTTVTPSGAPLPSPVWFLWDGERAVTVYSIRGARIRNLEKNRRVSLNFTGDGRGGDVVVLSGRASVLHDLPRADQDDGYLAKYADHIARIGMTPRSFAERYAVPLRIQLTRVRGH